MYGLKLIFTFRSFSVFYFILYFNGILAPCRAQYTLKYNNDFREEKNVKVNSVGSKWCVNCLNGLKKTINCHKSNKKLKKTSLFFCLRYGRFILFRFSLFAIAAEEISTKCLFDFLSLSVFFSR